jgi:Carboxypeptidase regulatory-like domain
MKRTRVTALLLFFTALLSCSPLYGQAGSGDITGEVRDASGGLVAGAKITLTRLETQETCLTASTDGGVYSFSSLKPGTYAVGGEVSGFKKLVREGIVVTTGNTTRVDLQLAIGAVTETVTVREDASPLKTESATLGQTIDVQEIPALPLNGRTFINLLALAPGVAVPPGSSLPRLSGSRPRTNEYQYDGIGVLQPEPGQVAYFPIVDAIQEFNVETNSAPAEFGRFNGGVINLTTKSGTNDYHGTVFEFLRNEKLNARNLFAPATAANPSKPEFRRNQFGFVAGGPIVREKTFCFVDYQGTRQLISRVVTSSVPTLAERKDGDFSKLLGLPLFRDPTNNNAVTTNPTNAQGNPNNPIMAADTDGATVQVRQNMIFRPSDHLAYASNVIPVGTFDPVAANLLTSYPLPTTAGQANNFSRIANEPDNQDQFDVRVDHRFRSRDQIFGRYSFFRDFTSPVTAFANGSGTVATGSLATGPQDTTAQSVVGNYQHTFSPNLMNEVRFGYTRRHVERAALLLPSAPSESLSLPGIPTNGAFNNEFPTFLIAGFQQLGPPPNTDSFFRTDVTEIGDTASWQHGRHTIKFGFDNRISRLDVLQPPSPTGSFTFSTLFTNLSGVTGTGNALASFFLGQVQQFSIDIQQNVLQPRAWFQEWFVQDDWKITSRLTVNMGTRYTLNFPSTEANDHGAVFNLQTQELQYLGQDGFPNTARQLHWKDFGPRLGISYLLTKKTVVRSGYGLTFFDQAGITTPFTIPQFPFVQTVTQATLDNKTPAFVLANGPSVQPVDPTPDAGLGQGVFSVDRGLGSGYIQQWNLAVQREVTPSLSFEVAYVGSKATHLGVPDVNLNQLTVDQLAVGSALTKSVPNPYFGQLPPSSSIGGPTVSQAQLLKPYPRFTNVTLFRNNIGNSDYHAVQAKLEKRFSRGLTFLFSYTRSKLIDDASSVFDASIFTGPIANFPVADSFNRRLEQDVSNGDIPNYFVASWVYQLPIGPGHRLHPSGVLGKFTNGWQISGIATVESGIPLALTQTTNFNAFAGFGTQRSNCLGDPTPDHPTTAAYFNPAAFAIAPQFTLGTCSRNPVRGPSYQDADLAFIKRTNITERYSLDFRTEIFNLTNTPPLNAPNVVFGSAAFGTITSAGDPRVIQLALKLNF